MLKFEWKKFFSKGINKVILFVLLMGTVILGFVPVSRVQYVDVDGKKPTGIARITAGHRLVADKNRWKGELTPEKITNVAESYHEIMQRYQGDYPETEYGRTVQSYWDIVFWASSMYTTDIDGALANMNRLAEKDIAHIYDAYADNLQKMAEEYGNTPEQEKFLAEKYKKIKTPVAYEACDSWQGMSEYIAFYSLILVIVIGFLTAGIFEEEFRNHAELIFFTAKYGRSKAVRSKIAVGMLATTIIYWAGIGILLLISFVTMGLGGFDTPYQFEYPYSFYVITQGQSYLLIVIGGYIACLLSASVTMLVAAKMHTVKLAVSLPFLMYYGLIFLSRPLSKVTNVFCFTTDVLIDIDRALRHPHIFQIGNVVFRQVPFVIVLYAIVSIVLLPFIYRSYSRFDDVKLPLKKQKRYARHSPVR